MGTTPTKSSVWLLAALLACSGDGEPGTKDSGPTGVSEVSLSDVSVAPVATMGGGRRREMAGGGDVRGTIITTSGGGVGGGGSVPFRSTGTSFCGGLGGVGVQRTVWIPDGHGHETLMVWTEAGWVPRGHCTRHPPGLRPDHEGFMPMSIGDPNRVLHPNTA